jgi:aryl-alcohol dehydrogenase-like predicted oxidoreductase
MEQIRVVRQSVALGASGVEASPMAWGMWRFAGDDVGRATELVEAALDAGITLFDTADIYGPDNGEGFGASEALLGRVFAAKPGLRDRMVLASKGGIRMGVPYDSSPAYIAAAVDASLQRLGVERLDLWQIHRPDVLAHPRDTAETLGALVERGKVRAVGLSNVTPAQTRALAAHLAVPLASVQNEYSPLVLGPLEDGTLDLALEAGHAFLAWSPLAQGRIGSGDPRPGRMQAETDRATAVRDALARHGAEHGVDATAAAYSWIMAHPARPIPIVGTQNPERIRAAADAFKVTWTRQQWYRVMIASRGEPLP